MPIIFWIWSFPYLFHLMCHFQKTSNFWHEALSMNYSKSLESSINIGSSIIFRGIFGITLERIDPWATYSAMSASYIKVDTWSKNFLASRLSFVNCPFMLQSLVSWKMNLQIKAMKVIFNSLCEHKILGYILPSSLETWKKLSKRALF